MQLHHRQALQGSRATHGTRCSGTVICTRRNSIPATRHGEQVIVRAYVEPGDIKAWHKLDCKHVVEAQQFGPEALNAIFAEAAQMEKVKPGTPEAKVLDGRVMATLFYEPSTRTRLSFESAITHLGGTVLSTESAGEYSSAAKGETLEDTIRTIENYADCIVLRHFQAGSAKRAALVSSVPIINAGDGPGQHPTQALLDVYSIKKEIGRLNVDDLNAMASDVDVLYMTRIQKERFDDMKQYTAARGKYIIDTKVMQQLRKDAVVLHPLPRVDEIAVEVDDDPRAAYFRQAKNGLYIRMAIVKQCLLGC